MGNGPAYDHMYAHLSAAAIRKREVQKKRADALHGIMSSIGFGEHDGRLTELEKEAARHLHLAYEILRAVSR